METDWRFLAGILALAILLSILIGYANAANTITTTTPTLDPYEEDKILSNLAENKSYSGPYVVPTPTPFPDYSDAVISYEPVNNNTIGYDGTVNGTRVVEVHQGDTVYTGDICDLRLVEGWYGKLVHHDNGRVVDISSFTRKIYINPDIFTPGRWDQWSDFDFDESNGNTIAFNVKKGPRPAIEQINFTEEAPTAIKPYIQPVPTKHVSDYVVARGDPIIIKVPNSSKIWMFGSKMGYYGMPSVNGSVYISGEQTTNMYPGTYVLAIDSPGNQSSGTNIRYDNATDRIEYFDPSAFVVKSIDLQGLDPRTRYDRFRSIGGKAADIYTEKEIVVEDPYIEIISADQVYHINKTAAQTIRGYTNAQIGTNITVVVDKTRHLRDELKYSTYYGSARGDFTEPGNLRWFEISVPLLLDNFAAGPHEITVAVPNGGSASVDFYVYESPEHSFIPNNTVKYVNGSEWRPDPTPRVVTEIVTQTIIQTVTIPVTPSNEQVYAQQKLAEDAKWKENWVLAGNAVAGVLALGVFAGMVWYARSVWRRL